MKKLILSLLAVTLSLSAESQSVMTYYQCSDKYIELRNIMETHDGNIIMNCPIFEDDNAYVTVPDAGCYTITITTSEGVFVGYFTTN